MIVALSNCIIKSVSKNVDIDPEYYDYYKYGIEITISSIFNISLILLFGLIIGSFLSAVCFLLCVIPLRQFCGGYHASTYFRCNSTFLLAFLADYWVARMLSSINIPLNILEAISLISLIPIILYAPVPNAHKSKNQARDKKCHIISFVLSVVVSVFSILFSGVNLFFSSLIIMSQATVSILIILEIIREKRKTPPTPNQKRVRTKSQRKTA